MKQIVEVLIASTLCVGLWAPPVSSEEEPAPQSLRVEVVLARFQGEKKIASNPYRLLFSDARRQKRNMRSIRMGVEVPVPTTTFSPDGPGQGKPATTFQYKRVGTDIDCVAAKIGEDQYRLELSIEHSYVLNESAAASPLAPMFSAFTVWIDPILRDGERTDVIAATDPVTGQEVRIEVKLDVLK